MNKKRLLLCWMLSLSLASVAQSAAKKEFEGSVTYTITAVSKTKNITTEELQSIFGDTLIFYIKKDNYRMSYNGLDMKNTCYIGSTNNQYAIRNGIDTLFVHACRNEYRTFVSATILNETDTIIGHKCRKFINDLEETKNHYWFDTTLYINPIHYQKHVFSYLNVYYEKTNSFWLKYKREGKAFDVIYTAIEINEKKLDDSIFELPLFPQKIE